MSIHEKPNNVHNFIPKDGAKYVGKMEDPYVEADSEISRKAFKEAEAELLGSLESPDAKYGFQTAQRLLEHLQIGEKQYNEALDEKESGNEASLERIEDIKSFLLDAKKIADKFNEKERTPDTQEALDIINTRLLGLTTTEKEIKRRMIASA